MRRRAVGMVTLALIVGSVFALSACGGDDETTTVEETSTVKEAIDEGTDAAATTTTPATSSTSTTTAATSTTTATTSSTTTAAEETTPGGAVVPAVPDCGKDEIYSEGSKSCVAIGSGSNPCPEGESPAADQPACLKD